jgi:hypothetical protein
MFKETPKLSDDKTLAKIELPEASNSHMIKLLRVDGDRAHFLDSQGQPWYFSSNERLWRRMQVTDISGMMLQGSIAIKPEFTEFENIDDAAMYALRIHIQDHGRIIEKMLSDQDLTSLNENDRQELRDILRLTDEISTIIDQILKEKVPEKRKILEEKFTALLAEYDTDPAVDGQAKSSEISRDN